MRYRARSRQATWKGRPEFAPSLPSVCPNSAKFGPLLAKPCSTEIGSMLAKFEREPSTTRRAWQRSSPWSLRCRTQPTDQHGGRREQEGGGNCESGADAPQHPALSRSKTGRRRKNSIKMNRHKLTRSLAFAQTIWALSRGPNSSSTVLGFIFCKCRPGFSPIWANIRDLHAPRHGTLIKQGRACGPLVTAAEF